VPRILRNLLSRLNIACNNVEFGCTAVVKLDRLTSHLQVSSLQLSSYHSFSFYLRSRELFGRCIFLIYSRHYATHCVKWRHVSTSFSIVFFVSVGHHPADSRSHHCTLGMYRIAILTGYRIPDITGLLVTGFGRIPDPDTGYRIQKTLRIVREFDVNNAIINKL